MKRLSLAVAALLVCAVAYRVFVVRYWEPANFTWDEKYHIASAQKYLNGVFFMEPHAPLGKLLIGLGEYVLDANPDDSQFIATDHASSAPPGFSFRGYRLIPVLLAWLSAPLFVVLFYLLAGRCWWAACFALLYVFDNAAVVHYRAAMLDGQQTFFVVLLLICFALLWRSSCTQNQLRSGGLAMGALFAAVLGVKMNGVVFALLWPALVLKLLGTPRRNPLPFVVWSGWGFFLLTFVIWQIHFSLARHPLDKLPGQGYYRSSESAANLIREGRSGSPPFRFYMLADALRFSRHYQKGVPRLNLCKDEENGSPPYFWPLGARAIDYRWKRSGDLTRYLYLVANPVCWSVGLLGVVAAAIALGAHLLFGQRLHQPGLLALFLLMYAAYMLMVLLPDRVFYLYHYLLPLHLSFILAALALNEVRGIAQLLFSDAAKNLLLLLVAAASSAVFIFFSPLTYYQPISNADFGKRAWLKLWNLRCAGCKPVTSLAFPTCNPGEFPSPEVKISGIRATHAFQQWGRPRQNESVEGKPLAAAGQSFSSGIGVHARSKLQFRVAKRFKHFSAFVGIPDYVAAQKPARGSVIFEVFGDGLSLWRSGVLRSGDAPLQVELDIASVEQLELEVSDAGDGIDSDHAAWLEPEFQRQDG